MQKKNILILFIIFINLSFSSLSKNDKVTRSENVEFRNGYYYIIGEKEPFTGIIEFQDESGKIMKGNFLNGMANGMAKTYSSDGRLLSETPYENGKKNGKHKRYYPNGNVELEKNYKNDKEDGMRISYYENGKIKIIGKWENDIPVGKGQVYDEEGNVIAETIYENGEVKILEK